MIALAAALVLQATAFDLVCEGTIHRGMPAVTASTTAEQMEQGIKALPQRTWQAHYRVDVAADRWCSGDCEFTQGIEALNSSRIVIDGVNINRTALTAQRFTPDVQDWLLGKCRVEQFSGLPTQAF